jgi:hypothetical protein
MKYLKVKDHNMLANKILKTSIKTRLRFFHIKKKTYYEN